MTIAFAMRGKVRPGWPNPNQEVNVVPAHSLLCQNLFLPLPLSDGELAYLQKKGAKPRGQKVEVQTPN